MKEQTEVKALKEGRYVVIDGEPCTIVSIATSKPGKHGSAKARIDTIGVFDGQKRSIVQPVSAKIYVPILKRKTAQVLSFSGKNVVQLMSMDDYSTFELAIPSELRAKLKEGQTLTYIECMGKKKIDMR
ncbi:MAG: translation initiation factor IF-5A [Methanosarcinales archaeon]|nr:MAG: translation initiation factor IF-5A [Methanosarcinales archaeon]